MVLGILGIMTGVIQYNRILERIKSDRFIYNLNPGRCPRSWRFCWWLSVFSEFSQSYSKG